MATLSGKLEVVRAMAKGMEKLGLTPEGVFRLADSGYRHLVDAEHFREVLGRLRLGLSQKELSCLVFVFDENCTGIITEEDYLCTLFAYKVGS